MLSSSVSPKEVETFSKVADQWWDERGAFRILHQMNPLRVAYARTWALQHFNVTTLQSLSLLDVGCGGGLSCEPFARLGVNVTGIDATPQAIAVARAHADDEGLAITYHHTTVEAMVAQQQCFDVVTCFEVVEHIEDPRAFVHHLSKLVKEGGLLIVSTLNRTLVSMIFGKYVAEYILRWAPIGAHTWDQFIKPEELSLWLRDGGMQPLETRGMQYSVMNNRWTLGKDTSLNYVMAAQKQVL